MLPVNLKDQYGDRFRIGYDEAADHEPGGRQDPWLHLIPCRYGHIYPHSDRLLAVYCDHPRQFAKLVAIPGVTLHQEGDTEAIHLFLPDASRQVAAVMLAKRKRRLSESARLALIERGRDHQFSVKTTG